MAEFQEKMLLKRDWKIGEETSTSISLDPKKIFDFMTWRIHRWKIRGDFSLPL